MIKWLLLFLFLPTLAFAQTQRNPCYYTPTNQPGSGPSGSGCVSVAVTNPLPVSGNTNISTYSASVNSFANSSAGDLFCINGSATKTVKVKGIRVSAVASAAVADDVDIVKRSTADTGGTPTNVTKTPHDSLNAAATATVTAYATAPSAGTLVGQLRAQIIGISTATTTAISPVLGLFQFTPYWDQPVVLRGVAEGICVVVPSTAGGQWNVDAEFTEE